MEEFIRIGCSGYVYKHWKGVFYPEGLPANRWLEHYAQFFSTVEINSTFYAMPGAKTFEFWRAHTPDDFVFAIKANRLITHMKKLKDPQEPLAQLYEKVKLLGPKLGPILFQLPPHWRFDLARLTDFLQSLAPGFDYAMEIRDPSWLNPQFFAKLEEYKIAYCISSLPIYQTPVIATASLVYFRFHGSGQMYYYHYPVEELRKWGEEVRRFAEQGLRVYCYFDNDPEGWAVQNALELRQMVGAATV